MVWPKGRPQSAASNLKRKKYWDSQTRQRQGKIMSEKLKAFYQTERGLAKRQQQSDLIKTQTLPRYKRLSFVPPWLQADYVYTRTKMGAKWARQWLVWKMFGLIE